MWGLSPNQFVLMSQKLPVDEEWFIRGSRAGHYALLYALKSHCEKWALVLYLLGFAVHSSFLQTRSLRDEQRLSDGQHQSRLFLKHSDGKEFDSGLKSDHKIAETSMFVGRNQVGDIPSLFPFTCTIVMYCMLGG